MRLPHRRKDRSGPRPDARRSPLHLYTSVLVIVAVAVCVGALWFQRDTRLDRAEVSARRDATFSAQLAATTIESELRAVRDAVEGLASAPGTPRVLAAPTGCTLSFGGGPAFSKGHFDIIDTAGTAVCSSLPAGPATYVDASWLPEALRRAGTQGPVPDIRTATTAIVVSAPFAGGAVIAVLEASEVAARLAPRLSRAQKLDVLVTSGQTVVSRSVDPSAWVAVQLPHPFAARDGGGAQPGVDGVARLYGSAEPAGTAWLVHVGMDPGEALAAAKEDAARDLWVAVVGLLILGTASVVVSRRIVVPLRRLRARVVGVNGAGAEVGPIVNGPREVVEVATAFEDLRQQLQSQLDAAQRLAAIVESSHDSIISRSADGLITSWNRGAENMYGYLAAEAIGRPKAMLVPRECLGDFLAIDARAMRGEAVPTVETRRLRKDGTTVEVEVTLSPVRDPSGAVVGTSSVARDLTLIKQAQADRRVLEERLQQAQRLETVGQLAGGIAHDFNNLLSVILSYAQFVSEEVPAGSDLRADTEQIIIAAERAATLTRQLLLFARREPVNPERIDANALVRHTGQLLARSIGEHIELSLRLSPGLPAVFADRGQVEQVLMNLVLNARDAMPSGGVLTIETSVASPTSGPPAGESARAPGSDVVFAVTDTGVGMDAVVAARAFEPFFTTKRETGGTGLGLATVYGIVTDAGGQVRLASEPGSGTTVRVYLPTAPHGAAGQAERAARGPRPGEGETILVVEDQAAVRQVTARLLTRNGYKVLEAPGAQEALALARSADLDLILTDVVMPHGSGPELVGALRTEGSTVAVLFMSGYSAGVVGPDDMAEGDPHLLQKPFNEADLVERVQQALARAGP
jgi:two-component system cell cycle sensor histidine kinase/response regulator CckA